jgi:hypothetical protein
MRENRGSYNALQSIVGSCPCNDEKLVRKVCQVSSRNVELIDMWESLVIMCVAGVRHQPRPARISRERRYTVKAPANNVYILPQPVHLSTWTPSSTEATDWTCWKSSSSPLCCIVFSTMAQRAAAAGRPGARFAQFKLVLLGMSLVALVRWHAANASSGESAVGKVRLPPSFHTPL